MKTKLFLFLLSLSFCLPGFAQKSGTRKAKPMKMVRSIVLTKKGKLAAAKFPKNNIFVVKENRIFPSRNSKIAYLPEDEQFIVFEASSEFNGNITNIDARPASDGGTWMCTCPQYPDDCVFQEYWLNDPISLELECEGSCGCGIGYIPPKGWANTELTLEGR